MSSRWSRHGIVMLTYWVDSSVGPFQLSTNHDLTLERFKKLRKLELEIEVNPQRTSLDRSISERLLSLLRSWPRSAEPRSLNVRFSSVGVQLGDGKIVAFASTRQAYLEFLCGCAQIVERLSQESEFILAPRCPTGVYIKKTD